MLLDVHQEIVLAKLRTAEGATFDSHADADNARCHPGTRVDILQQILAWGAARDGECVFWLNGMAGTGKSTISRTVAQSFADKGMLGASFFFKRGEGDRGRMAFFFTTIAAQLVHQLPSLAPHIRDAIEADPTISEKSAKDQFDKLIADPIKKLPSHPQPSAMVIVVDALDECDALEYARLIILLLSQAKHFTSVRLRFFVTSRPELPIRLGFEDISGKYEDLVLHQMPKPVIEHDITAFLQHELTKIRQDYNKSVAPNRQLPPRWPGAEQIQKLVGMAIPLFIFAATVCRFIQDRRLGGPKDQLARILEHQTSRKSNLDATYLPVLDQLLVKLPESEQREVAARFKRIVGSIVILASPLSTSSLARLLAVSLDSIEGQLDLFHSVLSIPLDPSIPVRLLHLSFRDFLVDPEKGREQERYPFWVDERETHERLAARCLQLLSTGDILKRNVCGLRLPGTRRSEIDQQTIDAGLPPEVQYACRYWVYHWKDSKRRIRDGDLVDRFLTRHLLHWLEALGLLGRISESIGMVDDLLGLLDVCSLLLLLFYRVMY
jgi:NACHT domain